MAKPWAQRQDLSHIWAWLQHPATSQISVWEFTFQKTWPLLHIVKSAQNTPPIFFKKTGGVFVWYFGRLRQGKRNVLLLLLHDWSDLCRALTLERQVQCPNMQVQKQSQFDIKNEAGPKAQLQHDKPDVSCPMTSPMLQWQVQCQNKQVQTHS